MAKLKFNVNIFDVFVVIVLFLIATVIVIGWNNKTYLGSHKVQVDISIPNFDTATTVLPSIKNNNDQKMFFSGSSDQVTQRNVLVDSNEGKIKSIVITVEGMGDIGTDESIFNGQKIYIDQKVDLRGNYYTPGYVIGYKYVD